MALDKKKVRYTSTRKETRWKDSCKYIYKGVWLKEEDALDRTEWKNDNYYYI